MAYDTYIPPKGIQFWKDNFKYDVFMEHNIGATNTITDVDKICVYVIFSTRNSTYSSDTIP